jgi:hypothetical protein
LVYPFGVIRKRKNIQKQNTKNERGDYAECVFYLGVLESSGPKSIAETAAEGDNTANG